LHFGLIRNAVLSTLDVLHLSSETFNHLRAELQACHKKNFFFLHKLFSHPAKKMSFTTEGANHTIASYSARAVKFK
jgi:hypothetical protein